MACIILYRNEKSEVPQTVDSVLLRYDHDQRRFTSDGETSTRRFQGVERELGQRNCVEMQGENRYLNVFDFLQ